MFKLITRADLVPDGATVTKVAGTKKYVVRSALRLYSEDPSQRREIACDDGFVFLVDTDGNAVVHPCQKELCFVASRADLRRLLDVAEEDSDEEPMDDWTGD